MGISTVYLKVVVVLQILVIVMGYKCYQCSYGLWSEGDYRDCIENPEALGFSHHLTCNRTSYCVLQEVFDIGRQAVTSYFRSCSGNSWGDQCDETGGIVTCKYSCRGDFCNQLDVGRRHEPYLERHPHRGHAWNSFPLQTVSKIVVTFCLLLTICRTLLL